MKKLQHKKSTKKSSLSRSKPLIFFVALALVVSSILYTKFSGASFLAPLSINRVAEDSDGSRVIRTPPTNTTGGSTPATREKGKEKDDEAVSVVVKKTPDQIRSECLAKGVEASTCGSLAAAAAVPATVTSTSVNSGSGTTGVEVCRGDDTCIAIYNASQANPGKSIAEIEKIVKDVQPESEIPKDPTLAPITCPAGQQPVTTSTKGSFCIPLNGDAATCGVYAYSQNNKCYAIGQDVSGGYKVCDWTVDGRPGVHYAFLSTNCPTKTENKPGIPKDSMACSTSKEYPGWWSPNEEKCIQVGQEITGTQGTLKVCKGGTKEAGYKQTFPYASTVADCPAFQAEIKAKCSVNNLVYDDQKFECTGTLKPYVPNSLSSDELGRRQLECQDHGQKYDPASYRCIDPVKCVQGLNKVGAKSYTTCGADGRIVVKFCNSEGGFDASGNCTKPTVNDFMTNCLKTKSGSVCAEEMKTANLNISTAPGLPVVTPMQKCLKLGNSAATCGSLLAAGNIKTIVGGTAVQDKKDCLIPEKAVSDGLLWRCPNADGTMPPKPANPNNPVSDPKTPATNLAGEAKDCVENGQGWTWNKVTQTCVPPKKAGSTVSSAAECESGKAKSSGRQGDLSLICDDVDTTNVGTSDADKGKPKTCNLDWQCSDGRTCSGWLLKSGVCEYKGATTTPPTSVIVQNYHGKTSQNVNSQGECMFPGAKEVYVSGTMVWRCPDENGQVTVPEGTVTVPPVTGTIEKDKPCFSSNESCSTGYCKPSKYWLSRCADAPGPLIYSEREQGTSVIKTPGDLQRPTGLVEEKAKLILSPAADITEDKVTYVAPEITEPTWEDVVLNPERYFIPWLKSFVN